MTELICERQYSRGGCVFLLLFVAAVIGVVAWTVTR